MKKVFSVLLATILLITVFAVPSFAAEVSSYFGYDFTYDGIAYLVYDDEVYVSGFEIDESDKDAKVVIPETVTHGRKTYPVTGIEFGAFEDCLFSSITLPSTIKEIGNYAFAGCTELEEVVIPKECYFDYFGESVFQGSLVEETLYSNDETVLGENVLFAYNGKNKEYTVPENIDILANKCFMYSGIEKINLNNNVTEIPDYAFSGCRNLKEITIPDCVMYLHSYVFKDCTNLETVNLSSELVLIGPFCFENTKVKTVHLGEDVVDVTGAFAGCNTLESITVDENNMNFTADENALYEINTYYFYADDDGSIQYDMGDCLSFYYPTNTETDFIVPDDVCRIGQYAFYYNNTIRNVTAEGVVHIDMAAFNGSTIESVELTDSVNWIEQYAFRNCRNLKDIDLKSAKYIGMAAFENCSSLKTVDLSDDILLIDSLAFANTGISTIEISGNNCYIGEGAFKECEDLTSVTFAEGVNSIGGGVFMYCSYLETVSLSKTIKEIDDNAFLDCEEVTFEVIKGTTAYRFVKNNGYNFEVVGNLTFFERIANGFTDLFTLLFGWIF